MTEVIEEDTGGAKLRVGVDVGGIITPDIWGTPEQIKHIFDMLPEFKFRKDDIMLCTYQKTGTHWLFEILNMVSKRRAELVDMSKARCMLELVPQPVLDQIPPPRVLNSHCPPKFLPKDLTESKIKTVLCLRNPTDTAVSYYNHMRGLRSYGYDGKFSNWLPLFLQGKIEYGKYTDYLKEWEKVISFGTGFPLHVVYLRT